MKSRKPLIIFCIIWGIVGASIAFSALGDVNGDVRILVGIASLLFPLASGGAAIALSDKRDRLAGILLLVSVATPTYFAAVLNIPALVIGLLLTFRKTNFNAP